MYQGNEEGTAGRFPFYPDTVPEELKDGRAWICCDAEKVPFVAQFPHYPDSVPSELKAGALWVCCDEYKVPMVPLIRGWRRASSTNPATWRTLDEVLAAFATGRYAGVGRVIQRDDGFVGVDIDDCRDPLSGEISPAAWKIIECLDSYSEISPSGTGVKVWTKSSRPEIAYVKAGLEIYPGGRYFVVTGQFLSQRPATIEDRSDELEALIAREFPEPERRARAYNGPAGKALNLDAFLDGADLEVLAVVADCTAAVKYRLLCPWSHEHSGGDTTGTFVGQYENGALFFVCRHAHCSGRRWHDFRRRVARPRRRGFDLMEVTISYG